MTGSAWIVPSNAFWHSDFGTKVLSATANVGLVIIPLAVLVDLDPAAELRRWVVQMNVRFHTNPDGGPHIYDHGVSEAEVYEALAAPLEQVQGRTIARC